MFGAAPSEQFSFRRFKTGVSNYERYAAALICSIVLAGLAVIMLFLLWLAAVEWSTTKETTVANDLTGHTNVEGVAEDFEEPGVQELADVPEPQLMDVVKAITNDPSTLKARFEAVVGNKEKMGPGVIGGDPRNVGYRDDFDPPKYIPDADRWQIRYTTSSRAEYARQLDYFKIELGAISAETAHIAYLSNVSAEKPTTSTGDRKTERAKERIYFRYSRRSTSKLKEWDLEFLKAAEVPTSGRILVQFYPHETRQMLFALERQELGDKSLESVLKTTFGVRATRAGFEYYVMDIKYR